MPELGDWQVSKILQGITQEAYRDGWNVLIFEHGWNHEVLDELFVQLMERHVQGIVVIPGALPFPQRYLAELRFRHIAVVGIDVSSNHQGVNQVYIDEEAVARLAVEYLLHLGHQRIGFIFPEPAVRCNRARTILHELVRRGLAAPQYQYPYTFNNMADHRGAYNDLLTRSPRPTAVITWNLELALTCLQVAKELGMRVPKDLSLFCCDEEVHTSLISPALTSIELHPNEIGRQAYHLILRRLQQYTEMPEDSVLAPETIAIKPSLVVRASCAPV